MNKSADISWLDRDIKRFKNTGRLIPESQARLYRRIAEEWVGDRTVVDVGCSIGVGSNILSWDAWQVWGIDINEEAIGFANSVFDRPGLDFAIVDIENCQGRKQSIFDVIVAIELLEHLADYRAGLNTIKKFFAPDGHSTGFITVPNIDDEQVKLRDMCNPLHLHRWRTDEFYGLMLGAFQSVEIYEVDTLLMAKVAVARQ